MDIVLLIVAVRMRSMGNTPAPTTSLQLQNIRDKNDLKVSKLVLLTDFFN